MAIAGEAMARLSLLLAVWQQGWRNLQPKEQLL
jgi:hypothetical protein